MNESNISKLIVTAGNWTRYFTDEVRGEFNDIDFVICGNRTEALEQIEDADAALVGLWDLELFSAAKSLKWVHTGNGGVEGFLFPEFADSNIVFTCGKPTYGVAGAESALVAMLIFTRRFHLNRNMSPENPEYFEGSDDQNRPEDIAGKTVGILGMGNMGYALAERATSLGLRVLGTAKHERSSAPSGVDQMFAQNQISELLSTSDFVVIAVPNIKETQGMVNESLFREMKKTAYLIDISGRAQVINFPDLQRAIEENWIAGVCLQPSGHRPDLNMPHVNSPFWKRDNVVMSPCRATSAQMVESGPKMFFENLRNFQKGEQLAGLVDKKVGY